MSRRVGAAIGAALALLLVLFMCTDVRADHAEEGWWLFGTNGAHGSPSVACTANVGSLNAQRNAECGGRCPVQLGTLTSVTEVSSIWWNCNWDSGGTYGTAVFHEAFVEPPPTCPAAGPASLTGSSVFGEGSSDWPSTLCVGGCSYAQGNCAGFVSLNKWVCDVRDSLGTTCTASGSAAGAPTGCAAGTCPGTVNGSPVCLPCASAPGVSSTGTSATTSTTVANADGGGAPTGGTTTTVQTSSTSSGGKVTTSTTTTTTTTNGAGATAGTSTTTTTDEKPRDAFCIENPSAAICRQSVWGGACGTGTCEGDAIQCAIAREMHLRNCTLFDQETTESTLGRAAAAGTDTGTTDNPAALANRESVALPSVLDQTPWLASGELADEDFDLPLDMGTLTIPWSRLNTVLALMGSILVAFSLVAAVRIVFARA